VRTEQVLERYLTLLSSEGSEENKIVSTTLLVYPMLKHIAQANGPTAMKTVISHASIKQFTEVILRGGLYSSKLTCQFLRLIDGRSALYLDTFLSVSKCMS
jgi:sialic acid synthase SpsE